MEIVNADTTSTETVAAPSNDDDAQLPPLVKLMRFIYLNNTKCEFVRIQPISLEGIRNRLQFVLAMAEDRPELPISIIKKVSI